MRPLGAHPHWNPCAPRRRLQIPGPTAGKRGKAGVEHSCALAGINWGLVQAELVAAAAAEPDPQDVSPPAQTVEGRRLPGQLVDMTTSHRSDERAQADRLRAQATAANVTQG